MWHVWGEETCRHDFGVENGKEKNHLDGLCVDGSVMLR
jgi:hypothetical protein